MNFFPRPLAEILVISSLFFQAAFAADDGLRLRVFGERNNNVHLKKRGNIMGTSSLSNSGDITYSTTLSLGGVNFTTLIDTGSSDLWVAGNVVNSKSTGQTASVVYVVGSASGPINTASLDFSGYQIQDQAYIQVTPDSSNPTGHGLIGLGPNAGSQIHATLGGSSGDTVLDRIFKQNMSTPNFLTVLMGRYNDPTDTFSGDITVGSVLPGYENVNNQPKMTVTEVSTAQSGNQHWQTLLDADGILGPDGNPLSLLSSVQSTSNNKQLTLVFDTGFSFPQVPKYVSDAVYGRIPGATFANRSDTGPIWQLPCDREVNMTFIFQGNKFPIHPLDTNMDINITDTSGNRVCVGAFQPMLSSSGGNFDAIMGMAFLRNAYILVNYGDFVDGTPATASPFIQLLATTNDTTEAHLDFVNVRMNGQDQTNWSLLPPSSSGSPPTPTGSGSGSGSGSSFIHTLKRYAPIIGGVAGGIILASLFLWLCTRRNKKRMVGPGYFGTGSRYQPLEDPAPLGDVGLHSIRNDQPQPYPGHQYGHQESTDYRNPWDSRY